MSATLAEPRTALQNISVWPECPSIYEINTWVWLSEMSQKDGVTVDLFSVPSAEWDANAALGFDAGGRWKYESEVPLGIAIANQNKNLLEDFRRALPDFHPECV